ncbi:MAG: DnaA regulatory inactivator Hda [Pseudomonadota bacterium]
MSNHPVQQLVLDLTPPRLPSFENFLPGSNGDTIMLLRQLLTGQVRESVVYLFGPKASGKTHLLFAAVQLARDLGFAANYYIGAEGLSELPDAQTMPWLALDHTDNWDARWQAMVFRAINERRQQGGTVLMAGREPPAHTDVREDVRTRLGWGMVLPVLPLEDEEKPTALAHYAAQRGIDISSEVIDYLITRGSRDLPSLLSTIVALDRFSLEKKRPITVPLLKTLWAEKVPAPPDLELNRPY